METSAKVGANVKGLFRRIAQALPGMEGEGGGGRGGGQQESQSESSCFRSGLSEERRARRKRELVGVVWLGVLTGVFW